MNGLIADIFILTSTTTVLGFIVGFVFECGKSCFKKMASVKEENIEEDTEEEDLSDLDNGSDLDEEKEHNENELECEDGVCMIKDKIMKFTDIISSTEVADQIKQITKLMDPSDVDLFKQTTEKILKVLPEFTDTNLFSLMDILQQDKMPTMRDEMNKFSEDAHIINDEATALSNLVSELKEQLN